MNPNDEQQRNVHRLVDIEVQEVSLVDRAANQHRFLIVKRSDEMDDVTPSAEGTLDLNTEAEKMDHDESMDEDQPDHGGMHSTVLAAAVEALERLTEAVEMLQAEDMESTSNLVELAHDLHRIATHLSAMAGGTDAPWLEMPEENMSADTDDANDGALLGDAEAVLAQAKRAPNTRPQRSTGAQEAKRSSPAPVTPESTGLSKQLADLTAAVQGLNATIGQQHQRLARLEKQHGLPNSKPPGERPGRRDDDTGWPMDLNKPLDRSSVDKATSFHDV